MLVTVDQRSGFEGLSTELGRVFGEVFVIGGEREAVATG
jgi:hypothetical protein